MYDLIIRTAKIEERTAESTQNVPNDELISKKSAIDEKDVSDDKHIILEFPIEPERNGMQTVMRVKTNIKLQPGIIRCTDIEYIINIVRRDFEEILQESMNQFKICRGE